MVVTMSASHIVIAMEGDESDVANINCIVRISCCLGQEPQKHLVTEECGQNGTQTSRK